VSGAARKHSAFAHKCCSACCCSRREG
jgi:hypothetical protein